MEMVDILLKCISQKAGRGGPGHASASFIAETNEGPKIIGHVSYMPGIASPLAGLFLGFLPVTSRNFPDIRDDDIQKAKKIIRCELTKDEFTAGVGTHQEMAARTDKGELTYAITGASNPCAAFLTGFYGGLVRAEISVDEYIKKWGFHPVEDCSGLLLTEEPKGKFYPQVFNCVSMVQEVLRGTGAMTDMAENDAVLPATLAQMLLTSEKRFQRVEEPLVGARVVVASDEEEAAPPNTLDM